MKRTPPLPNFLNSPPLLPQLRSLLDSATAAAAIIYRGKVLRSSLGQGHIQPNSPGRGTPLRRHRCPTEEIGEIPGHLGGRSCQELFRELALSCCCFWSSRLEVIIILLSIGRHYHSSLDRTSLPSFSRISKQNYRPPSLPPILRSPSRRSLS